MPNIREIVEATVRIRSARMVSKYGKPYPDDAVDRICEKIDNPHNVTSEQIVGALQAAAYEEEDAIAAEFEGRDALGNP